MYDFEKIKDLFEVRGNTLINYKGDEKQVIVPSEFGKLTIGKYAFADKSNLETVMLLDNVQEIDMFAFEGCHNLKKVYFANKDTEIDPYAFSECFDVVFVAPEKSKAQKFVKNKKSFSFEKLYKNALIYPNTFEIEDGVLLSYNGRADIVVVPYVVHTIEKYAFWFDHLFVKEIVLLNNIKVIKESAFYGSTTRPSGPTKLVLPQSLLKIENGAIRCLQSLEYLEVPGSIYSFDARVLDYCKNIRHIKFNYGVREIKDYLFLHNENLKIVEMPPSITYVEDMQYGNIRCALIVGEEESYAIREALKCGLYVKSTDKEGFVCDEYAFESDWLYNRITKYYERDYEKVKVTSNGEILGKHSISWHQEMKQLIIPSTIRKIEERAISSNSNLEKIIINPGVEEIETDAIIYCRSLKELYIPKTVVKIGSMYDINSDDIIVYGSLDSEAYNFAKKHSFKFIEH